MFSFEMYYTLHDMYTYLQIDSVVENKHAHIRGLGTSTCKKKTRVAALQD